MTIGKKASDRIGLRGGVWYYTRRVPKALAAQDPRVLVKISLKTDDKLAACVLAESVERELEAYWASLAGHDSADAREKYDAAVARARIEGFIYKPVRDLINAGAAEAGRRLLALEGREHQAGAVDALLGGVEPPQIMLSGMVKVFEGFVKGELLGKREDQLRRWRQARQRAVDNLIEVLGSDQLVTDISRDDGRRFRDWWLEKIAREKLGRNVVNKQIGQLSRMFSVISDELRLDLFPAFEGLTIPEIKKTRPPIEREWMETVILRPGALDGLNATARAILLLSMETGLSFEEATSLERQHIKLKAKIPHVVIESRDEALQKTDYRSREIPLTGVSLLAAQAFPGGFPRYYGKTNGLSATVNNYLRDNKMLPEKATFYSIRHSFQDRLTAVEAPERLQADLMGHKFHRERYGKGPDLAQKLKWLEKIAYQISAEFTLTSDSAGPRRRGRPAKR